MFSPISAPCRPCKGSRVGMPLGRDHATKPNASSRRAPYEPALNTMKGLAFLNVPPGPDM
jgi:hypothetical protein